MSKFLTDDSNLIKKAPGVKSVGNGLYIPEDMKEKEPVVSEEQDGKEK